MLVLGLSTSEDILLTDKRTGELIVRLVHIVPQRRGWCPKIGIEAEPEVLVQHTKSKELTENLNRVGAAMQ